MSKASALPRLYLTVVVVLAGTVSASAQELEEGLRIPVVSPITGDAVKRLEAAVQEAINRKQNPIKKIVFDFNPDQKESATRDYGPCYDLAKAIRGFSNNVTTVAYVSNKVSQHTVLPVLACTELVMSRDARIGEIVDQRGQLPPATELDFYAQLAGPGREAFVLKMADKNVEVIKGTRGGSTAYIDARKRDVHRDVRNIDPVPVLPAGAVELYTAEQARAYGLAKSIANSLQEVAELYQITPASLRTDSLIGREPSAWRIDVTGTIDPAMREAINRRLRHVVSRGANIVFLQFDSGTGGNPSADALTVARELADDIRGLKDADGNPVLTVAFVPTELHDTAVLVALGCSEIVMARGAEIRDFRNRIEPPPIDPGLMLKRKKDAPPPVERLQPEAIGKNLRDLAEARGYATALFDGLVDKDLIIVRARGAKDATKRRFMTEAEFNEANANEKLWVDEGRIKNKGEYLKLTAEIARDAGIARHVVADKDITKEAIPLYGLDSAKVQIATPDWLDSLSAFLRKPEVSILLVVVGIACLILELKVPGIAIPGIIAAMCFVLFFWAQSDRSGQISFLAILLFLLGLGLIAVEIFILPGFGVTGISGILFTVFGLGLATVDHVPQTSTEWGDFGTTLMQYGLSLVAAGILAMFVARYLPNVPGANRLMLVPPTENPAGDAVALPGVEEAVALLGQIGLAETVLRPAGMAKFGERYVDVVSDGGYIEAGSRVQVIEIEGNRVVVKQV